MSEDRMELFIETLTGTAFELSCSPLETIVSIKAKIQYSEGIPVSQQHLIWKSQELNDDLCLQDYEINDGATLKLVLGMRGGPINTRQITDTKKLKNLAEYVEKRSETSGSGGRPFTVLVFHDGDKVHMYTLVDRGDCTVSPVSGTISDSSSVASLKQVEELDQEIMRENEATKEKIAQLQEQIRALNIKRNKRPAVSSTPIRQHVTVAQKDNGDIHLPALHRVDSIDSCPKQYLPKEKPAIRKVDNYFSRFTSDVGTRQHREKNARENKSKPVRGISLSRTSLDSISEKVSTKMSSRKNSSEVEKSYSSFLPEIKPLTKRNSEKLHLKNTNAQSVEPKSKSKPLFQSGAPEVKYPSDLCPLTSNQALSTQRLVELDHWMQSRPKTTPEGSLARALMDNEWLCKNKLIRDSQFRNIKRAVKNPLSVSYTSGDRSGLMMDTYINHGLLCEISSSVPCGSKSSFVPSHSNPDVALNAYSPPSKAQLCVSKQSITKTPPKGSNDISRPSSARKASLLKAKKKSYKRCSLCSKRTGLATSYTCRCGKNFCAPHRYAEVHNCSYDYKTEGRKLLQLNNPVVTASKLPKI